jgi:hypothetical protein
MREQLQNGAASVGNRAPPHGGGVSGGVLPLRATTTAVDSKRDARAAAKMLQAGLKDLEEAHF